MGTDTTTAIRMFLTQALSVNGFPFEIKRARTNPYEALSEAEFLEKLEKSRQNAAEGKYRDASEVSRNMRGNMDYKIVVTKDAEEDLDRFIQYLIFRKKRVRRQHEMF